MQTNSNYEKDFYKWSMDQAELLRSGKLTDADIENIAEEIESMGRSEKRELISRLTVLLIHLLKWDHQPSRRSKSWLFTILEQRRKIQRHMKDNPSLKSKLDEILMDAYFYARLKAIIETGLDEHVFPEECTYTYDEAMEKDVILLEKRKWRN